MRKALVFMMVLMLAATVQLFADDGSKTKDDDGFWDGLKAKLRKVIPDKRYQATTAVGGERGTRQDEADALYWKGKEEPVVVAEDELAAFNSALGMALEGKRDDAVAEFESFLEHYPESLLAGDAKAALEALRSQK